MDLLSFGKTGWGDELFYATLMTIAVSITAMLIGFLFSIIFLYICIMSDVDYNKLRLDVLIKLADERNIECKPKKDEIIKDDDIIQLITIFIFLLLFFWVKF